MNIPYDTSISELEKLVSEFAEVDHIKIPRDRSGYTRGFAYIFLKNVEDVDKVIEYVDGRHMRQRQIRAKKSLIRSENERAISKDKRKR